MNSRGAMEIILGLLALQRGIISQELFVALVITAIVTSMMSGPALQLILKPVRKAKLEDSFRAGLFLNNLGVDKVEEAVAAMAAAVGRVLPGNLDPNHVTRVRCAPEDIACAAIVNDVVLYAAGVDDISQPFVVTGLSQRGLSFNGFGRQQAQILFLILSPKADPGIRGDIVAELSQLYRDPAMVEQTLQTASYTDFLALIKTSAVYLHKE